MAASKPSPTIDTSLDDWDSLLAPTSSTTSNSSPPLLVPASSSSSGEFHPFSFVGAVLAGGGGAGAGGPAAGTTVFCLLKDDSRCLGSITGGKFCLKLCDGEQSCNVPTHASRKAKLAVDHFYIKENETKAYCDPKLRVALLTATQLKILQELQLPKDQWVELFKAVEAGDLSAWFPEDAVQTACQTSEITTTPFALASPGAAEQKTGIFGVFPSLSYEDDNISVADASEASGDALERGTITEISATMKEFKHRFNRIKTKWTAAFQDIEVGHLLVTSDIERLGTLVQTQLGKGIAIDGTNHTNVWEALSHVASSMQQGVDSAHQSLRTLADKLDDIVTSQMIWQTDTETQLVSLQETLHRHESRFSKIFPFLMNLRTQSVAHSSVDLAPLQDQIATLSATVTALQDSQWNSGLNSSNTPQPADSGSMDATLRDLQAQVKLLQVRIVGSGVQIGGIVFQCFDDVRSWVTAKFQVRRYGLFVDGVSLLDFFSFVSHTDTERSVSAYYNQQKSGFISMYEARVAASTQNLFPMVFGRSNSGGLDDSEFLPALQDPDKWDNGLTGLRYQISRGMSDVEFQLESSIDSILRDYPEPRQIAKDCLYKAKRFVTDLCNFITQDFQKWQHRGHGKKDSWRMTTVCVRRIFEEIHSQRVVARDILDVNDADFSCAKFLWATWKAHDTMALYVRHQFYEHPSIAAVLARHLADNHIKPDAASGSKISNLEKAIKGINARIDSVNSNIETLDSRLDSLKDTWKPYKGDGQVGDKKYKLKKSKDKADTDE